MFDHASILNSMQLELGLLRHRVQSLEHRLTQLEPLQPHPPPKSYRDVTAECEWVEKGFAHNFDDPSGIYKGDERIGTCFFFGPYRLRKITSGSFLYREAFVIEKECP